MLITLDLLCYTTRKKKLTQSSWISFVLEYQANEIIEYMFFHPWHHFLTWYHHNSFVLCTLVLFFAWMQDSLSILLLQIIWIVSPFKIFKIKFKKCYSPFKMIYYFALFLCVCLPECMHVYHVCACYPTEVRREHQNPVTQVTNCYEPPCEC